MKKVPISFGAAIFILIAGLLLGSVFTFGKQYWNAEVDRDECALVETQFVSYRVLKPLRSPGRGRGIDVICVNEERYHIDVSSDNADVRKALSELSEHQKIILLIHPNSDTIMEFTTEDGTIMSFDETVCQVGFDGTGFLVLGMFSYFCSLVGLYYTVFHIAKKRKR